MTRIGAIVEGHGEVEAVPVLLRLIHAHLGYDAPIDLDRPVRVNKGTLLKPGELERYVHLIANRLGHGGRILVLIDADDDCPAFLGTELLRRVTAARPDRIIRVVIAKHEFEAWLLASAESLRGRRGLSEDLEPPTDPESVRGAKEWLGERMESGYVPTLDQPALTAGLSIDLARRAASFDKMMRECATLLGS